MKRKELNKEREECSVSWERKIDWKEMWCCSEKDSINEMRKVKMINGNEKDIRDLWERKTNQKKYLSCNSQGCLKKDKREKTEAWITMNDLRFVSLSKMPDLMIGWLL